MDPLKVFEQTIFSTLNTPYLYGGNGFSGRDCSGAMNYLLQAIGVLPHKMDLTSQGLYDYFKDKQAKILPADPFGMLLFYGANPQAINHVNMALNNLQTIGAEGGTPLTKTLEDAIKHDAFMKIKPQGYRGAPVASILPNYPWLR